jgi:hypothetical protein
MKIINLVTPFGMRKMDIKYTDKEDKIVFIKQIILDKLNTFSFHNLVIS